MSLERPRRAVATAAGEPWTRAAAAAAALFVVRDTAIALFRDAGPLRELPGRAIGRTAMLGVDGGVYAGRYVFTFAAAASTFLAAAAALALFQRAIETRLSRRATARTRRFVALSFLFATFTLALGIVTRAEHYHQFQGLRRIPELLAVLGTGALCVLALRTAVGVGPERSSLRRALRVVLGHPSFLAPAVLAPGTLLLFARAIGRLPSAPAAAALFVIAVSLVLALEAALLRRALRRETAVPASIVTHRLGRSLLVAAAPWLLAPFAIVAANELQYSTPGASPRVLAATLVGLLAAAGIALALARARLEPRLRALRRSRSLLALVVFPSVVLSAATLCFHQHDRERDGLDLFHIGELTLPTQQLFSFGSVPLFDFLPIHTLSDVVYPSLYALLHGVHSGPRGLDPLLWNAWMPSVVALLLAYFFVARLISPLFAIFFALATPVLAVVPPYYAPALVPALFVPWAVRRPTLGRLALLVAATAALGAWRLDFGVAGAAALAATLVCAVAASRRPPWRALAGAFVAVGLAGAALLLLFALLAERDAAEALSLLVRSYAFRFATRTREALAASYSILAAWQYYLLPAVAAVAALALAHRRLLRAAPARTPHYLVGFVAVFALAMSVRSTERHTLYEAFNPYLFYVVLVFLPAFLGTSGTSRARNAAQPIVLALLLLRLVFVLPPAGYASGFFARLHLLPAPGSRELRHWRGDETRLRAAEDRHLPLVEFLRNELDDDETFFDFTHSPALYVLADRRLPTYLVPVLAMTAEPIQAQVIEELERWRATGRLPLVVFRQGSFWDALDGVPTEVGSYRIAEWIYRHYRPFVSLEGYDVFREARASKPEMPERFEQRFPLALRDPRGVHDARYELDPATGSLEIEAGDVDPHVVDFADLSRLPRLSPERTWRIELEGSSSRPGALQLFYRFDDQELAEQRSAFVVVEDDADASWSVELRDVGRRLTGLRLDPPAGARFVLRRATAVRSWPGPVSLTETGIRQRFDLARLPFVWAHADPLRAAENTRVLADLLERRERVVPGTALVVPIPDRELALQAGYLELRLRWTADLTGDVAGAGEERSGSTGSESEANRYLGLLYGPEPLSGFDLEVLPPGDGTDGDGWATYLVRLTTQWRWATEGADAFRVGVTGPVEIAAMRLRSAD